VKDRPGATPLPLTFLGLAIATTVYAGLETQILSRADFHTVGWLVLAVPVPTQFLAAVWAMIRGELAAATASSVLTATWLAIAAATITSPAGAPGPTKAEGLLLFASAAAMSVAAATALAGRARVATAVMLTTTCRFVLTGISGFTHADGWTTAAGVAGFVLAGVAFAAALAIELRSSLSRR
jgi:succinate-acetate transporter protein